MFGQVCQNVNPECFPNYYYVGSGWDSRYSSPLEIVTSVRGPIVEYSGYQTTPDGQWGYPNGLDADYYPACSSTQQANTISGAFAVHKETSEAITTSIGIGSLYSGSSSTFTNNSISKALKYSSYSYDSFQICSQYALSLNVYNTSPLYNLTSQFKTGVASLPTYFNPDNITSAESNSFKQFYTTYGDAFITSAIEGGLIAQRATVNSDAKASMESQDIVVSQQAQISFDISIGESSTSTSNSSSLQTFQSNATFSAITVIGGDPGDQNNFTAWQASLTSEPLPVAVKLYPIYIWMNEVYFPDDSDILSRATAYSQYTQWFLETQNHYQIFIPFYNVAIGSPGDYQATATVTCPTGSVLLSGGCTSTDLSISSWPWRMTNSFPQVSSGQQSFSCDTGEDDGVYVRNLQTIAFAMCSPASYDVKITSEETQTLSLTTTINQADSSNSQKYNNSVTATCPSGSYVVGGGCSISDSSNNHPWIQRANYPSSSSSWYCFSAEDYNTDNHDVTVTAYAVCAEWTSELTYAPNIPTNYTIVTCTESGSEYSNECTSECPQGYFLAGGGCSVGNLEELDWPWRLTSSYPENNGWYCLAGQDRGRGETYIEVIGYAICLKFNADQD